MSVLPYLRVDGPRAPLSRIVPNRDSIDWAINETLADLLQRISGIPVARWMDRAPRVPQLRRPRSDFGRVLPGRPGSGRPGQHRVRSFAGGAQLYRAGGNRTMAGSPPGTPVYLARRAASRSIPGWGWRRATRRSRATSVLWSGDSARGSAWPVAGKTLMRPPAAGSAVIIPTPIISFSSDTFPPIISGFSFKASAWRPTGGSSKPAPGDTIGDFLIGDRSDDQSRLFYKRVSWTGTSVRSALRSHELARKQSRPDLSSRCLRLAAGPDYRAGWVPRSPVTVDSLGRASDGRMDRPRRDGQRGGCPPAA